MVDSLEALLILIVTMPGFLGYLLFNRLHEGCVDDTFEKVGIVVGFNVGSIAVGHLIGASPLLEFVGSDQAVSVTRVAILITGNLVLLTVISLLLGCLSAWVANSKLISDWIRASGLTRKSNSKSIMADIIRSHPDAFFRIRFKEGGYIIGHPLCYSLDGEETLIFLEKAAVRPPRVPGSSIAPVERDINGPGVVLLDFEGVKYIELV